MYIRYLSKEQKNRKSVFPSYFYDEEYFRTMAPNCRQLFRESYGHMLGQHRMGYFQLSKLDKGMKLIDLGCGAGEFLMYCALKTETESWGIDYSAAAIKIAKELCALLPSSVQSRIHLELGDCTELGNFHDDYFDRIIWFSVIEHLYDWQIEKVLKESFRILKPGGIFITETHPNRNALRFGYPIGRLILNILKGDKKSLKFASRGDEHVNIQSPQSIKRHFTMAGFQTQVILRANVEFVNYPKWVKTIGHIVRNRPPLNWLFGDEITVIAAKSRAILKKWNYLIPSFISLAVG